MAEISSYNAYIAAKYLWTCVSPIFLLVGTISNIISILVLTRKKLLRSNTMIYLAILSGADIAILWVGLLRYWLRYAFNVDIRTLHDVICRIDVFFVYFTNDFINWLLVIISMDRCLRVCFPLKFLAMRTRKTAKKLIVIILSVLILINIHLVWNVRIDIELGEINCSGANYFTNFIWSFLDLSFCCLLPFVIMIICNASIIRHLQISQKRVANSLQTTQRDQQDSVRISGINRTLQLLSLMFLVLTLPSAIYEIYLPYFPSDASEKSEAEMELVRTIVYILLYSNNVLHFFLYLLTNQNFKQELRAIFKMRAERSQDENFTVSGTV